MKVGDKVLINIDLAFERRKHKDSSKEIFDLRNKVFTIKDKNNASYMYDYSLCNSDGWDFDEDELIPINKYKKLKEQL